MFIAWKLIDIGCLRLCISLFGFSVFQTSSLNSSDWESLELCNYRRHSHKTLRNVWTRSKALRPIPFCVISALRTLFKQNWLTWEGNTWGFFWWCAPTVGVHFLRALDSDFTINPKGGYSSISKILTPPMFKELIRMGL